MARLVALLVVLLAGAAAGADDAFPAPDGRAVVTVTRRGDVRLTVDARSSELGPMPWGPPIRHLPEIPIGGRFERAVWSPDARRVAVAGRCRGFSGVTFPPTPRCATDFIRVVDARTGAPPLSLAVPWSAIADEMSVVALAFAPEHDLVAALVRVDWSDCSWGGVETHLHVWDSRRGAHVLGRLLARARPWARRALRFEGSSVVVSVGRHRRAFSITARP